jgi:hypothetical protein
LEEKLSRREHLNAEPYDRLEVSQVVCDDRRSATGDSDLRDHIVVRVTQKRSPQEKDVLLFSGRTKVVDDREDVGFALTGRKMPQERTLVLDDERDRNGDIERTISKMLQQCERSARPRTPCRNEDRRVEDD